MGRPLGCRAPPADGEAKSAAAAATTIRPNIVYILADDLGYGDVKCLNPEGKIATPNIDRLAAGGMRFTDAHACSAVCTPSRYGILTGRYSWRSRLEQGVLMGLSPRLIEEGRLTVPMLLKRHVYQTACFGKWHLGMDWPLKAGAPPASTTIKSPAGEPDPKMVDFSQPIKNGPNSVGFDYYYGITASADLPPFIFIENDRCQGAATVEKTFIRTGLAEPSYEGIELLPTITRRAVEYIARRAPSAKAAGGQPLFLYLPLPAPHAPILPSREFQGKSGINAYADFVMQVDDTVGQVLAALDRAGLADSTLVIVTSDNGCAGRQFPPIGRQRAFSQLPFPRFQGRHLRRRAPDSAGDPLAGDRSSRLALRSACFARRFHGHLRRFSGRETAGRRGRRQRQHVARAARSDEDAVA